MRWWGEPVAVFEAHDGTGAKEANCLLHRIELAGRRLVWCAGQIEGPRRALCAKPFKPQ